MPFSSFRRKAAAVYHTRRQNRFEPSLAPPRPLHIQLEPTVRCNLHCLTCTRDQVIGSYARADMSLDQIDHILALLPGLQAVKFQGLGEPLLAGNVEELLKRFAARGIRLSTISNGTVFHLERYRRLALTYFRNITVSIDATSPELFARLRVGARLERVLDGLRALAAERDRAQRRLTLGVNFVVSHENVHEVGSLYDLAVEHGLDFVSLPVVENWTIPGEDGYEVMAAYVEEARRQEDEITAAASALKRRLRRRGILTAFSGFAPRLGRCYWPFKSLFISVEGLVTPCCIRMHRDHALGNIFEVASIDELWQGAPYRQLRQAHLDGDAAHAMCGQCPG